MKICILEAAESIQKNFIDAHVRQAKIITDYLKSKGHIVYLLDGRNMRKFREKDFDVVIKSYAAFYENYADEIRIINDSPKARLYWLTNEYDLEIGGSFTKLRKTRNIDIISNFPDTRKMFGKHYMVNMNALFYSEKETPEKKYNVCYYGTYRKNRAVYFKKYINNRDFILSTSPKNFKKFASIGCKFTPVNKFTWGGKFDTLGYFRYTVYIEDTITHTLFNNLADRFYEALSNKTVILFDKSCVNTLRKSEISSFDWNDFLIESYSDIQKRNYQDDWSKQEKWIDVIKDEKTKALQTIEKILTA